MVTRQVVFGEQINNQAGTGGFTESSFLRGPVFSTKVCEVTRFIPRDVVMREPFFSDRDMSIEFFLNNGFEFGQQIERGNFVQDRGHGPSLARSRALFFPGLD